MDAADFIGGGVERLQLAIFIGELAIGGEAAGERIALLRMRLIEFVFVVAVGRLRKVLFRSVRTAI